MRIRPFLHLKINIKNADNTLINVVSTGAVRLDKRAEAPGLHKTGNFSKLTDNSKVALAA